MITINPNVISEGDPVIIQDENKNVLRGIMIIDDKARMAVKAFRVEIPFARWSQQARDGLGGYVPIKGIKITGHEPPFDGMLAMDVVPKQLFRKTNPT
jgi:hypothetical protein